MSDSDTANDVMLAQMLQLQFDEEYEKFIKARENKMNGTSKGIEISANWAALPSTLMLGFTWQKSNYSIALMCFVVSISFDNYRTIHPGILESDSTSSEDDQEYEKEINEKTKQSGNLQFLAKVLYPFHKI